MRRLLFVILCLTLAAGAFAQQRINGAGTFRGELTTRDSMNDDGKFYDRFTLNVREGEEWEFVIDAEFDSYLYWRLPNGSEGSRDDYVGLDGGARLDIPSSGTMYVDVSSYSRRTTGSYSLEVINHRSARSSGGGMVSANGDYPGSLDAGDAERDNRYVDWYEVRVASGQQIEFVVEADFDSYVYWILPNGEEGRNDDYEGLDAGAMLTMPSSGVLRVGASRLARGSGGNYVLELRDLGTPRSAASDVTVPGDYYGSLDGSDAVVDSRWVDWYEVPVSSGDMIEFVVDAPFDSYVYWMLPNGEEGRNDDYEGLNAGAELRMPSSGILRIGASRLARSSGGDYVLVLRGSTSGGSGAATRVRVPGAYGGSLTASDAVVDNRWVDWYEVQVSSGQQVEFVVDAGFDSYVYWVLPDGSEGRNDDYEGLDAGQTLSMPQGGTLRIGASRLARNSGGDYTLVLRDMGRTGSVGQQLGPNDMVRGVLDSNDALNDENRYVDWYQVQVRRGWTIEAVIESDWDSYLYYVLPDGTEGRGDDYVGLNGGASMTIPQSGTLMLGVSSFGTRRTGSYTLRVSNR